MDRYEGFREFVLTRSGALLRTAYLLTGDQGLAEDLLQIALARTAERWNAVRRGGDPEAYIRRALYNEFISGWRRRKCRPAEHLTDKLPERPEAADEYDRSMQRLAIEDGLAQRPRASARSSCSGSTRTAPKPRPRSCSAARSAP
jgi:DNA-directed RNA polymerase specialized sigma24 family protein